MKFNWIAIDNHAISKCYLSDSGVPAVVVVITGAASNVAYAHDD